MSLHEDIAQAIRASIEQEVGAVDLSPTSIANGAYERFGSSSDEAHTRYAAIEHIKAMARTILAQKFEPDDVEILNPQQDMFSGLLQKRYPLKRSTKGTEPIYRPLECLSVDDLDFNVQRILGCSDSLVQHAQALQAYRDRRFRDAA